MSTDGQHIYHIERHRVYIVEEVRDWDIKVGTEPTSTKSPIREEQTFTICSTLGLFIIKRKSES